MRFVTVRELRLRGGDLWRALQKGEEAILTVNGKPVALLVGIGEGRLEEVVSAFRQAKALAAVGRMREVAARRGLDRLAEEEIEAEIRAARRERRR
jgi:antitoxin (DNA-binding transcriptional repressor) of toxin-antitoxin stability system